ncbi:RE1-silencing transcription factor [Silurus meridionalis]|uniref:C2H2-type domain-containing protein n=1 Tax=Silurus meridionalis TaxID=175797 RepID=A0A8T0B0Y4_SILME|nr:RE1-silencing transcription factor [Silurus meridionalis]KAF7698328.1 hypothetical protein HF521_004838 [Silurus meridionalis]
MNSQNLQQNFILFLEKKKDSKEALKSLNGRLCCAKCRFSTKDTALYERHVAQHEEVTFSCNICNHVSYSRVESQRHLVKHKGSFPYKCSWCHYGAVRRDYMVKHIQRIHGKSADGIFKNDCPKKFEVTKGLCLTNPRTLGGPSHDVKALTRSAENLSGLLSNTSQTKTSAPYHVSSTTCSLPVIKTQPSVVPNTTHAICKVSQGIFHPPVSTVKEVGPTLAVECIKNLTERTSLESTAVTSVLPRVHVNIFGDRAVHQKPPLQSQSVSGTAKTPVQPKIIQKIQVGLPVSTNKHLKTLLSNQSEPPVAQKSVIFGPMQNIQVAHVAQKSVPSTANPTIPVERFRQGVPSTKQVTQTTEKQKTRPNILVRRPAMTLESSAKSGVQVGLLAPLNQPIQHSHPLMISSPKERNLPQSNVQVELLAPLNQPIQHNKPLTVSCPEEITIPAGCLVELVEVKNVNGTRELELRLVPQLLPGPQQVDKQSNTVTSTTSRVAFKCRVAADNDQPINMNHEITPKANVIPEHLVQRSHLKKLALDKVNVKNETEVKKKALCSRRNVTPVPGSSSKWLHAVSKSEVSNPSDLRKFTEQPGGAQQGVVTEQFKAQSHMNCTVKNVSPLTKDKSIKAEGFKYENRASEPSPNKLEDAELSYQGLPVISSVFSLCPIPQDALRCVHPKEIEAQMSVGLESKESTDNPRVCRPALKAEEETSVLPGSIQESGKLTEKKEEVLEEPQVPEDLVKEKLDTMGEENSAKEETKPELCRSSPDVLPTDLSVGLSSNMNSSSVRKSDSPTQPEKTEKTEKTTLESEKTLLAQNDGPLASSLNPTVALIRMPSLECFSASESANKVQEKPDSEESVTARPVVCCMSNQQNQQERTIKLVLKRKRSENETAQDHALGLVCVDISATNKKARKEKKRAKKHKSSKGNQLLGKGTLGEMFLTPLKLEQLVKRPGPNQPVVVLNHPNPLIRMVSIEEHTLNNQDCRISNLDLCNQEGSTSPEPVGTSPALKMTLKKVQGQTYQVTELLLKGVFKNTVLG